MIIIYVNPNSILQKVLLGTLNMLDGVGKENVAKRKV